jgi:hypothetical protein
MRWRRHGRREVEDVVKDLPLDEDGTKRKVAAAARRIPETYRWCEVAELVRSTGKRMGM